MNRPLRIAHLNFIDEPGVTRKLKEQASAARELGIPMDFFVISPSFDDSDHDGLHYRRGRGLRSGGKLAYVLDLLRIEDLIGDYLDPDAYDFFILRFGKLFIGQGRTYRRHGPKIVTEHHTDEIPELLVKRTLARRLLAAVSARRSARALRRVAGIVAVTSEILKVELRKSGPKPALVWPNGISVPATRPVSRSYVPGQTLHVAFVAATFQTWQGVDRLMEALAIYRGPTPIHVHLIGKLDDSQRAMIANTRGSTFTAQAHGLVSVEDVRAVLASCHVAIGSLAATRKALHEACSLKNREYAAWGLPLAITFYDPDFPAEYTACLRLEEEPAPLDLPALIRFAERVYAHGDPGPAIHQYAVEHLDWKVKLPKLYEFLRSLPLPRAPTT